MSPSGGPPCLARSLEPAVRKSGADGHNGHVLVVWPTVACLLLGQPAVAVGSEALWALLQSGGQVVVMRHASTDPGVGDPQGFRLGDCATQRNLSPAGREEARRIGSAFRVRGVPIGRVLSSRWCRCLETAHLAFGGVETWPPLDSFFSDRRRESEQTKAVRALVGDRPARGNLILVTHQVNISALTGISPASGEMIVLSPTGSGSFQVRGRLAFTAK